MSQNPDVARGNTTMYNKHNHNVSVSAAASDKDSASTNMHQRCVYGWDLEAHERRERARDAHALDVLTLDAAFS